MDDRFSRVVVLLDLEPEGDRAIGVAGALAVLGGLPIELVTVSSPGMPELPDRVELEQRAHRYELESCTCMVLHSNEPALVIAEHVAAGAPLIVMASAARGAIGELVVGGEGAGIVASAGRPVLVVGPHVLDDWRPQRPTLVVCVGPDENAEGALAAVTTWVRTFGGSSTRLVGVRPGPSMQLATNDQGEMSTARRLADHLLAQGVKSQCVSLSGPDPATVLDEYATQVDDAVLMVTSSRWAEPRRIHLRSMARRLAHDSSRPVLVVPSGTS